MKMSLKSGGMILVFIAFSMLSAEVFTEGLTA